MYTIFCDESWTGEALSVPFPCYVFYGVLLQDPLEEPIICELNQYKQHRGLWNENGPIEVKWVDAGEEAKSSAKSGLKNRYEGYLDIFFRLMRARQISFGYLFLSADQYRRVEPLFSSSHDGGKHAFFFMLYFQFLYHCFIKTQTGHKPTRVFIDDRDMGAVGARYDTNELREFLNKRLYREAAPQFQLPLGADFRKQLENSLRVVDLASSKAQPLIQLADLCAGCVRHSLENRLAPPAPAGQMPLFDDGEARALPPTAKSSLATYFYSTLRSIPEYDDIDLAQPSYHHRFSIFPFQFGKPR
jgi:hypothetical protein